jgi:hypothetical protein
LGVSRTVDDDVGVVREGSLSSQDHHQQQQQRTPDHVHGPRCGCAPSREELPRLTASELRFAVWLERRLRFVGAQTFVARRGLPLVKAALYDGVVVWSEARGRRGRWEVNGGVRNPAGFLRWLVDQRVRSGG